MKHFDIFNRRVAGHSVQGGSTGMVGTDSNQMHAAKHVPGSDALIFTARDSGGPIWCAEVIGALQLLY